MVILSSGLDHPGALPLLLVAEKFEINCTEIEDPEHAPLVSIHMPVFKSGFY